MEKLCKTCKFFTEASDYNDPPHMTCDSPKTLKSYKEPGPPVGGIQVEIDEGWGILVDGDFGCVNWEFK